MPENGGERDFVAAEGSAGRQAGSVGEYLPDRKSDFGAAAPDMKAAESRFVSVKGPQARNRELVLHIGTAVYSERRFYYERNVYERAEQSRV